MKLRLITLALITGATAALAHGGVKDKHVMGRMMGMSSLAEDMKTIGKMAKGEATFDAKVANAALARITKEAAEIPALFATPATDPKSEALPVIWEQFDTFTSRAQELETLTANMVETVMAPEDLGPVVKQVGKSCSACHSEFRE